jgi:hypothetical protein
MVTISSIFFLFFFSLHSFVSVEANAKEKGRGNTLTPKRRHLMNEFVAYDSEEGNVYEIDELEFMRAYELRASYSATRAGRVRIELASAFDADAEDGAADGVKLSIARGTSKSSTRKLLDVEKIAFKVVAVAGEDKLFINSTRPFPRDSENRKAFKKVYARVTVDSSNVIPSNGYKKFPHKGVTFNLTLEECFFFGLVPIHSIPVILLCLALVVLGFAIRKPFGAFLWKEDFTVSNACLKEFKSI